MSMDRPTGPGQVATDSTAGEGVRPRPVDPRATRAIENLAGVVSVAVSPPVDGSGAAQAEGELTSPAFERALRSHPVRIARAMMALNLAVHDEATLLELLGRAARVARDVVPGVQWASVTAQLAGTAPFTADSTDDRATTIDEKQYANDDGPCLRAIREHRLVSLDLDELYQRWPDLASAAERSGARRMLAAPLSYRQSPPHGALNLYAGEQDTFGEDSLDLILALSEYVARGLDQYATLRSVSQEVGQLRGAMARRAVIEQAKGVLMTRHRVSADEAFELLRLQSQHTNVKLAVVASEIVRSYAPHAAAPPAGRSRDAGRAAREADRSARPPDDFQSAFDHAPIGMAMTNPWGRLLTVNPALCDLLGRSPDELLQRTMFDVTHPDDVDQARGACEALAVADRRTIDTQVRLVRRDGTAFDAAISTAKVVGEDGEPSHLIMHVQDVSAQRALTDELRRAAVHDALTGLPNRVLLLDRLTNATMRHARDRGAVSLLYLDLDDFKSVNDTYGHDAGDRLLMRVARILDEHVRPGDTVARVGGDEFVVLCDGLDEVGAAGLAARLASALEEPIALPSSTVTVQASIGTATTRGPGPDDPAELLSEADSAMYAHKLPRRPS